MLKIFHSKNISKTRLGLSCESGAGFTLIETMIYTALFSIIIGGGMATAYQIITSTQASSNQLILQEETDFLLKKP